MKWKLLAIDLDGTLLNSAHALPPENRAALHRIHAAGVRIVLCTGRAFTETRPVIEDIGLSLDATVTVFGALVTQVTTARTLYRTPIARPLADRVTHWLQERGFPVLWLTDPNEQGDDGFVLDGARRHPNVDAWVARTPCHVRCLPSIPPDAAAPLRISIIDDEDVLTQVSPELARAFDGELTHNVLHAPPYRLSLIEIFDHTVNKWFGIEKVCRLWDIPQEAVVAIGDDVNDVAMLRNAGLGVAVANARPAAQAAAQRMTATNDECGVARLIEELLEEPSGAIA